MLNLLSLILISASFASVEDSSIVKTLDGKVAHCNRDSKIDTHAYLPNVFSLTANNESVLLNMSIMALSCAKNSTDFQWVTSSFNAPINKVSLDGIPFAINMSDLEFRLIDSNFKNLAFTKVSSEHSVGFNFNINVNQVLNGEDLIKLESGKTVSMQWTFFLHGVKSITMNGKTEVLGQFTGGSYLIRFDLSKDANGLLIQNISIQ